MSLVTTDAGNVAARRGMLSRLVERLTTPLLPADYLDVIHPLLSGTQLRGRIVEIRPETRDAVTVVIKPGRGWHPHTPGQYLRLGVDVDGVRQWRAYSLTSPTALEAGCLSITVKAVPGGVVSDYLVHRAAAGVIVHLDQAAGEFVIGAHPPAKLLFITAGSGITPVMGMLRNMERIEHHDIVLVHSAPSAADVIFGDELRAQAAKGRIRLVEIHTRTTGRLDPARISEIVPDIDRRQTWACGPSALLDAIESQWASAGIAERLRTESFRPAFTEIGTGGVVNFSASGVTIDTDGRQSILEAGEATGVLMPSGCRMGICFGCVVPLRRGAIRDMRTGEVTIAADGNGVDIQTCISAAAGECDIDL